MTRGLAIVSATLAGIAGLLLWRLLDAHAALGRADLAARLNADAVIALQDQERRNQLLEARLEQLSSARDTATRETVREIYVQPASDACRRSPAMRALDGRLRYRPDGGDGRASAAPAPAEPVPATGRPSR